MLAGDLYPFGCSFVDDFFLPNLTLVVCKDLVVAIESYQRLVRLLTVFSWRGFSVGLAKAPFHSIGRPIHLGRTQSWRRTMDPRAPFHSKQICRKRDPGLLIWGQSIMLNLCFGKRQSVFTYNSKRKSTRYSILSLQVASLSSATSCCMSDRGLFTRSISVGSDICLEHPVQRRTGRPME